LPVALMALAPICRYGRWWGPVAVWLFGVLSPAHQRNPRIADALVGLAAAFRSRTW
jgi:hypothetical protein